MASSKPKTTKGSTKVVNPNTGGSKGFLWVLLALLLIGALVIGLIVYNGRGAQSDRQAEKIQNVDGVNMEFTDNTFTLSGEGADGAKEAALYEDFSCHYCAELAEKTDDKMLDKIKSGELTVKIHPMIFLDGTGGQYNPGHSTHTLAAVLALAEKGETEAYWNLRKALLEQQQSLYGSADANTLADMAKDFGASKDAVEAIRNGDYEEKAKEVGVANEQDLEDKTGELSSPRVLVDGKDVESNPLENWIDDLLAS
ncbi:thioredoxin domain-containing protein [Corynebacterium sp. P3-F1]|uniref:DsbA family protein n=1 Tax=Corynebacterium sp. P3-F1 TaxID=3059080 RepID=UPI00265D034F|nr:thioredoxin domain-containing protein [Corynebacterium sp. P3-F1]WKK62076.1 thioredoxin domain-containing protein [Corynebacterium sp. P3-F1]